VCPPQRCARGWLLRTAAAHILHRGLTQSENACPPSPKLPSSCCCACCHQCTPASLPRCLAASLPRPPPARPPAHLFVPACSPGVAAARV
jgi:hypothetical protein